jgi:hypothetical protein
MAKAEADENGLRSGRRETATLTLVFRLRLRASRQIVLRIWRAASALA